MLRTGLTWALPLALCITTALPAQREGRGRRDRDRPAPTVELEHFEFKQGEFEAPSLRSDRPARYGIYLPKGHADEANAGKKYPLAIWLHGMRGNYRRFHDNDGPQILDKLRGEQKIPEMIFVAVSASRTPVYVNGTQVGDEEDYIVKDLLGHLEKTYPVATDRSQRAIMGVSIGGMGAMRLALLHADKFGVVATHSAAVLPADITELDERMQRRIEMMSRGMGLSEVLGDPIEPDKWAKVSTTALARDADLDTLRSLAIYFDAGTADRYGFGPPNKALSTLLEEREVPHEFELVEGGEHSWGSGATQKQLPKSLAFVAASFAKPPEAKDEKPSAEAASKPVQGEGKPGDGGK